MACQRLVVRNIILCKENLYNVLQMLTILNNQMEPNKGHTIQLWRSGILEQILN